MLRAACMAYGAWRMLHVACGTLLSGPIRPMRRRVADRSSCRARMLYGGMMHLLRQDHSADDAGLTVVPGSHLHRFPKCD